MKYEKPRCDCGAIMNIEKSYVLIEQYKITNYGNISKKLFASYKDSPLAQTNTYLICPKCYFICEIDKDVSDRIIREKATCR